MKRDFILRGAVVYLFIAISAFSNNKIKHAASDLRLIRMEEITKGGGSSTVFLQYDQSGRITGVSDRLGSGPAQLRFNVTYEGKRIIMSPPTRQNANADVPNAIILLLDANNRVVQKIAHHHEEFKSTSTTPQQGVVYLYDSTTYQYDARGKLIMEIATNQDSVLDDNGGYTSVKIMRVMNYNPVNARIGSMNHSAIKTTTTQKGGKVTTSEDYLSSTLTFEYLNDYPFQTDFSNAAVLNELHPFSDLRVIGGYAFLPSNIRVVSTEVHDAGNVTRDTASASYRFSYDKIKMVSSMKSSAVPDKEIRYFYGKPPTP